MLLNQGTIPSTAEVVMKDGDCLRANLFCSMRPVANVEGLQLENAGVHVDSLGNIFGEGPVS